VSTDRVDQYPSVSRDNRYVAYISNAKPVGDLMIIDLVTGQIRDTGIDAVYATWSPVHDDVLAVHLGTESGGIQIIRSDGTVLQRTDGIPISSPVDWSRDGRYLLASTGVLDLSTGVFLKHLINNVQLTWLD
jgi:hypothetical protein